MPSFAYLRKSVSRDPAREVSHEVQEAAVRELAARHGDPEDLVILSDWDKSGRLGADKRPGYRTLLDAIDGGRCDAVYSYSLSRLGRSVPELSRLIDLCGSKSIPVRLYADALDTSTASGRMQANILGSVAAFEADVASERVRAAYAAKLARGESLRTSPIYGERDGEDIQAVLDAFELAGSYSGAAKLLNMKGIKPRNSKRGVWWPSSVAVIIKRMQPDIVIRKPTRGYKVGGSDFILARLLRCPTCDTMLTGTRDRDGRRVRYSCRLGSVDQRHKRVSVTESHILPAIQEEVAHLVTPESVQNDADTSRRAELEARRARILDMFEAGHIDREDRERRLATVQKDIETIDSMGVLMAVPTIDWSWPPKSINAVLRALFIEVALDPDTFQPTSFVWSVPEWRKPSAES